MSIKKGYNRDISDPKCDLKSLIKRWKPVLLKFTEVPQSKWELTAVMLEQELQLYSDDGKQLRDGFIDKIDEIRKFVMK